MKQDVVLLSYNNKLFYGGGEKMRTWLKELRRTSKMSQQNVADILGITQQYYNLIESGERQSKMSIETAQKLAAVFDVPFEYVLEKETKIS